MKPWHGIYEKMNEAYEYMARLGIELGNNSNQNARHMPNDVVLSLNPNLARYGWHSKSAAKPHELVAKSVGNLCVS